MSEPFHAGPLRALRTVLAPALAARRRVSVIVDNLDKAWDVGADVPHLSRLMLALLAATEAFRNELERSVPKAGVSVSLSLFMRSDIFAEVARLAHEPDKLPVRHLRWEDEVVLLQVVEQRYAASRKSESAHGELWSRFFCERVGDERVTDWLMRVCLPRPRDVLFLCRAAIDHAVAARHARIEEQDLTAARGQYSLFAFESAAVESQLRISRADDVLLEFAGAPTTLVADQLAGLLDAAGVAPEEHPAVLDALRDVSFLGIKTGETGAVFADVAREKQRADILARKWAKQTKGTVAYEVHPAFWAYLEMERAERNPTLAV
jgi:hypothetical protein